MLTVYQNLVRKALYFNYDRYKELGEHAFLNEEDILRRHISKLANAVYAISMTLALTSAKHTALIQFAKF